MTSDNTIVSRPKERSESGITGEGKLDAYRLRELKSCGLEAKNRGVKGIRAFGCERGGCNSDGLVLGEQPGGDIDLGTLVLDHATGGSDDGRG